MSLDSLDDFALDSVLSSGLSALAPDIEPVDAWLVELRPRFQRARTRRRVVRATGALMAFLVVGAFAIAQVPNMRRAHVTVESHSREPDATRTPKRATTRPRHSTTTAAPTTLPATTNAPPGSSASIGVPGTAGTSAPVTGHASSPPSTQNRPQPTVAPSQTRAFDSFGGSISVRFSNGRLALLSVSPTKGNHADIRAQGPTRIDVWFMRKGHSISHIEVVVRHGRMYRVPDANPAQDDASVTLGPSSHMSSASGSPVHQAAFAAVRALPAARRAVKVHASKPHPSQIHSKKGHADGRNRNV